MLHSFFFLGHTEDIKCMAVHPNRMIVASGKTSAPRSGRRSASDERKGGKSTVKMLYFIYVLFIWLYMNVYLQILGQGPGYYKRKSDPHIQVKYGKKKFNLQEKE